MRLSRLYLWAMVATVGVTAAVVGILLFSRARRFDDALVTGLVALGYLAVGLGCAVALERGRAPRLMWSGIAAGTLALVAWLAVLWVPSLDDDLMAVVIIWPAAWACLALAIGLLLLPGHRPGWWAALRRASFILLAVLAGEICLSFTFSPRILMRELVLPLHKYDEMVDRLTGALALLAGGAVVTVFVGAWIPGLAPSPAAESPGRRYWIRCPRCGAEQHVRTGPDSCARCGLGIRVELA